MKCNRAVNRAKLVDEPIVEMLLSRKYFQSGIKFMKSDLQSDFDGVDLVGYSNGFKQNFNVKRNSSKYYNSPNFTFTVDKSKVCSYKLTRFIFIDEINDCLYLINGEKLCKYILENSSRLRETKKPGKFFLIIPKSDLISLVESNDDIIKYSKAIANLFALGRDESIYDNLT